jgi:hypothetical protein
MQALLLAIPSRYSRNGSRCQAVGGREVFLRDCTAPGDEVATMS